MKPNLHIEDRTHTASDIGLRNQEVAELCKKLLPQCQYLFTRAIVKRTANSRSAVVFNEATAALDGLLKVIGQEERQNEVSETWRKIFANVLIENQPILEGADWILERSKDLSLAIASFWFSLGDGEARIEEGRKIIAASKSDVDNINLARFNLITSRFYLEAEALCLFASLNVRVQADHSEIPIKLILSTESNILEKIVRVVGDCQIQALAEGRLFETSLTYNEYLKASFPSPGTSSDLPSKFKITCDNNSFVELKNVINSLRCHVRWPRRQFGKPGTVTISSIKRPRKSGNIKNTHLNILKKNIHSGKRFDAVFIHAKSLHRAVHIED
ncbi:MAG: hypothetical protein WA071_16290 [Undibacterium umbellatum]|uniref:hypothetical protein n=1 Tax=Undibacterium umbellatum TaxID=2762300 RepID=UPI003BB643C0